MFPFCKTAGTKGQGRPVGALTPQTQYSRLFPTEVLDRAWEGLEIGTMTWSVPIHAYAAFLPLSVSD